MRILFLIYILFNISLLTKTEDSCPEGCLCEEEEGLLSCFGLDIERVPSDWPNHYKKVHLIECQLSTVQKNAFRRWGNLEEIRIERNLKLDLIDKLAFKGLKKLREIHIHHNPRLSLILKLTFSSIQNEFGLNIHISNNSIEMIENGAFKNSNNIRNLKIEEKCYTLQEESLSSITQLDFIYLSGVCSIQRFAFSNTSRVHSFNILNSKFDISPQAFSYLNHIYQLSIYDSTITLLSTNSFVDIKTVGTIKIERNTINVIQPKAFIGMENVGSLLISNNNIIGSLSTPEIFLLNEGAKIEFRENNVNCNCEIIWMDGYEDKSFVEENFCGPNEGRKSIYFYKPSECHSMSSGSLESRDNKNKSLVKARDKELSKIINNYESSELSNDYITSGFVVKININLSLCILSIILSQYFLY